MVNLAGADELLPRPATAQRRGCRGGDDLTLRAGSVHLLDTPGCRCRIRNPVVLFLATGLLALVVIVVGTAALSERAASDEAIAECPGDHRAARALGGRAGAPARAGHR